MQGYHKSVLAKEVLDILNITKDCWYLDCTLGDGGHSLEILKQGGNIVGIDVDPQALERTKRRFEDLGIKANRYKLIQGNFRDLENLIQKQTEFEDQKFTGSLFDLGVSSLQLDSPQRGFSFARAGPLDMRMDPNLAVLAMDLVNALHGKELYEIFKVLGEEKYSRHLADVIVRAREIKPFTKTDELAGLISRTIGRGKIPFDRTQGRHPATRVFQALRIVVNDELRALEEGLDQVKDLIKDDGRIVVISFHSLEDRIVKNTFKSWTRMGIGITITKKPLVPGEDEIRGNPRSRSAKLRIFEEYEDK